MGLFGTGSASSIHWVKLQSEEQLHKLLTDSEEKAVAIFKHSTRCNISLMVKSRLEKSWKPEEDVIPVYLDLLTFRNVSDAISELTGIRHESPQMIVFRNGQPIYNASHGSIDVSDFSKKIAASK